MPGRTRIAFSHSRWPKLLRACWLASLCPKAQFIPSTIRQQPMCRNWRVRNTAPRRCALCFTCRQASLFASKPIRQTMMLSSCMARCWGKMRSVRLARFANSTSVTRRRIHALPMPVRRQRCSGSSSAARSTCRLPTILQRGSGKSSVPSPTPPGLSIQQGKKWLTAASSPRYATGHAWD